MAILLAMQSILPTSIVTIQSRLPRDTDGAVMSALDAYAELFSRLERSVIATRSRGEKVEKNTFLKENAITGRQFNAIIRSADGKIDSQLSNLPNYIADCEAKTAAQEKRIKDKEKRLKKTSSRDITERLFGHIRQNKAKIQRIQQRKAGFERMLKEKKVRICMGSKKLFRQQYNLAENGFDTHDQWLNKWRRERSSQFFVLGSKDENAGCQGCVIIPQADGLYTLKIRLPDALEAEHGKHCYVTDIRFTHDKKWLDEAIIGNRLRKEIGDSYNIQAKDPNFVGPLNLKSRHLSAFGQALSYRFVRDDKRGWRVLVTTLRAGQITTSCIKKGAIGVDLNNHHLSVTEVDSAGNKVSCADLVFRTAEGITSRKTRTALEMAAVQIVDQAKRSGKPVILENLDFRIKKQKMIKGQDRKVNKMISALVYRKFRQIIETRAFKEGVEIILINPAYTSFIAKLKYLNQTENNVHQAAALVIARRGMGLRDRLPASSIITVMGRFCTFLAPEDARKDEARSFKKAMSWYGKWYTSTRDEARKRRKMFRLRISSRPEDVPF